MPSITNHLVQLGRLLIITAILLCCDSRQQEMHFQIPTRDGTAKLNTVISLPTPALTGSVDLVFERTPYGLGSLKTNRMIFNNALFAYAGQDDRGCHDSTGSYEMWRTETTDSQDSAEFLKENVKFSGKIFGVGASANAISMYFQPKVSVPWLKGQCLIVGTADVHKFTFQGGAFRQQDITVWLRDHAYQPQFIPKVLEHEAMSDFWEPIKLHNGQNVTFPSMHMGGWNDLFLDGTLNAFEMYRKNRPNDTYLIVLPTGHCEKSQISYPGLDLMLHPEIFCPYLFKYGTLPMLSFVTFYVMGPDSVESGKMGNFYVTMKDFPETRPIQFNLTPQKTLVPISENDSLNLFGTKKSMVGGLASIQIPFVYNPSNPTPSLGGNNLLLLCGPYDQRENEKRADNIVFSSVTFKEQMLIVGRMSITFKVTSNCTDTDFVVRLSDVYPDGRSMLLGDSIQRMRWRESDSKPTLMTPGKIYQVTIDMWPTAYFFNPGHAMRIAITSSNYPRFSVNPNNGLNLNQNGTQYIALNTLFIDETAVFTLPLVKDPFYMFEKAKIDIKKVVAQVNRP